MANGIIAASQLEMASLSGTGTITIAPPATNTDRTLTLPDASGTVATTAYVDAATSATNVQTFDVSGTWDKPAAGSMARIQVWGGGGGGARSNSTGTAQGGGGGGYNESTVPLATLASSVTVTIGAGGLGRTGSIGSGTNGGNSSFGSVLSAFGGGGGGVSSAVAGSGGGPLSGPIAADVGGEPYIRTDSTESRTMGSGANAGYGGIWHGGGGAFSNGRGGGSIFGGGGGALNTGIRGLSVHGGNGGQGSAGAAPGGGGGGNSTANVNGSNGAAGRVIVTVW